MSQDNSFFEKTKIQHKINEARHNFIQGNVKSALLNYKEAIALNPSNVKAEYGLAECYYKLQNYKKAKLNFLTLFRNGDKNQNPLLFDKDTIIIKSQIKKENSLKLGETNLAPDFIQVNVNQKCKIICYTSAKYGSAISV